MILYHGGYCPIETPQPVQGKCAKDFSPGFYCTPLKEQALRWSRRFKTPVISIANQISFNTDGALQCLSFQGREEVKES